MLKNIRFSSALRSFKMGLSRKLIWRILFVAILSVIINSIQFYFFYDQTLNVLAEQLSFILLPSEYSALSNSMPSMFDAMSEWLFILMVLQLALSSIAGCWLSYRLYGPVDRIRQALVAISMGQLDTVVKTREGDELHDIAEGVSDSAARLQVMVISMKENLERIEESNLSEEQMLHLDVIRNNLEFFETIDLNISDNMSLSNE